MNPGEEHPRKRIDIIRDLVKEGVLGPEMVPDPDYWHWPILKPELLPPSLHVYKGWDEDPFGEIRWYGE